MAEVTVDSGPRMHNFGDMAAVSARVDVAATGDVWTHGLRSVESIICPPRTNLTNVVNNAQNKIEFTTDEAVNDIQITVIGWP